MTKEAMAPGAAAARAATSRAAGFLILWVILSNGGPGELSPGIVAALVATAVSLRLVPPARRRIRAAPLAAFSLRFLQQSIIAGIDVARRALDPRLPINPGLLLYPTRLPRGLARNTLTTIASLLPGSVPIGSDDRGRLVVHCLDLGQPMAEQLATEEALLQRVISRMPGNG